ncbi:MAG TPA: glycosyltransferase, partial [Thermoleophilia bacterium]|nr:glycosyltransferase [Thermoleophilia bacterium]
GKSGVVVRGDRPADLARELESLLADRGRRERLGAEAARQAQRRFTLERWLDETTTVYEQSARGTARRTVRGTAR